MSYDEGLAQRIREYFQGRVGLEEKKMFGGLCFMISGHMCCGIVEDSLMARVGPDAYELCLEKKNAGEMDFTGRAMKGFIYVTPDGITLDNDLSEWLQICLEFVKTLPPK